MHLKVTVEGDQESGREGAMQKLTHLKTGIYILAISPPLGRGDCCPK